MNIFHILIFSYQNKVSYHYEVMGLVVLLIWERRAELGISDWKLGRMTGISASTINRIENGVIDPKLGQLEKIAKALGCKISDLYMEI